MPLWMLLCGRRSYHLNPTKFRLWHQRAWLWKTTQFAGRRMPSDMARRPCYRAMASGSEDGRLRLASKELRRRGCILIWSNDRGGAPALKHCAGAHKMEGLVVTSKLQALKHCAGAAKIAGVGSESVTVGFKGIAAEGVYINME